MAGEASDARFVRDEICERETGGRDDAAAENSSSLD